VDGRCIADETGERQGVILNPEKHVRLVEALEDLRQPMRRWRR
jgi:hypothetical protein